MNLNDIAKSYHDEDSARAFLEAQRWPDGKPACTKCGEIGRCYRLQPKEGSSTRKGLWKCGACRKQFTVTVDTIFEDSHIPLNKWLMAIHLLCSSKKGMSAHQLHRMLGVTYKSAWFMAHRIRYAMAELNLHLPKLSGTVEVDETYIGGKQIGFSGMRKNKAAVVSLVERGGKVRSIHQTEMVTGKNLKQMVRDNVESNAHIMTDDSPHYYGLKKDFRRHSSIRHKWRVYARKEGDILISTNTIEGYFSILKRGINGVYHHVGKQHLHRYLSEFDFRYNSRNVEDGERSLLAIRKVTGKRLKYQDSSGR